MFEEIRLAGNFTLSSGRKSSYFYDFNLLLPHEMTIHVKQLVNSIPRELVKRASFIASPAHGGIVPGFLAAFALDKPFVILGKDGELRGPSFMDSPYIIVDDVVTSFQAVSKVQAALKKNTCIGVAALMYRGSVDEYSVYTASKKYPLFYLARGEQEV